MGLSSRLLLAVLSAAAAQAHFALLQPPSALSTENGGKGAPPCGEGNESRIVTSAQGGRAIAIRLTEFVFHPGHYRFALSVNSRSELPPDPGVVEDGDGISISAAIQNPATAPILADGVFLHSTPPNGDWQMELTLPNLNCEKCTLQISEFMAEHGAPFFYHHCADLKITADPSLPPADASWPKAAVPSNSVFPHVATGGGWSTVLALINTSGLAVAATIAFRGDEGSDLGLLVTTTQDGGATNLFSPLKVTVNPDSTLLISTAGQLAATVKGWADVRSAGALGG